MRGGGRGTSVDIGWPQYSCEGRWGGGGTSEGEVAPVFM